MHNHPLFKLAMISALTCSLSACGNQSTNDNGPKAQQYGLNRTGKDLNGLRFNRDDMNWEQGNGMSIRGHNIVRQDNHEDLGGLDVSGRGGGINAQGIRNYGNHMGGTHHNDRMEISQKLAENISAMPEVHSANVLLTNENAYVAVVLEHSGSWNAKSRATKGNNSADSEAALEDSVKSKIDGEIRKAQAGIRNIYISANPDFVARVNNIAEEASRGHAIQGFIEEFNSMVRRVFPAKNP
ncbi:YhcN/YlaJ family sporulation lipoprotein [Paenibacillus gansuensis]|uniref:YhcN/YlaJ family sporulation lipoprotein n=1 Tax=Paenibacillus gansuensis TaxID=306542 RepID=A0ABW5PBB7_9BACL